MDIQLESDYKLPAKITWKVTLANCWTTGPNQPSCTSSSARTIILKCMTFTEHNFPSYWNKDIGTSPVEKINPKLS